MNTLKHKFIRSEKPANATEFLSDVYKKGTQARKFQAEADLYGRSMVEMLGVLAIIGVLSVGAIAGYSKAMTKYKLNKHAKAVNMLINNVLSIKDRLEHADNNTYYNLLLYKANLLPDGIIYARNSYEPKQELSDIWFKNKIGVAWSRSKWTASDGTEKQDNIGAIYFYFDPSDSGAEVCRNVVIAAKENHADLDSLKTFKTTDSSTTQSAQFYGDKLCNKWIKCLRNLNLDDIANVCNSCKAGTCMLTLLYQ